MRRKMRRLTRWCSWRSNFCSSASGKRIEVKHKTLSLKKKSAQSEWSWDCVRRNAFAVRTFLFQVMVYRHLGCNSDIWPHMRKRKAVLRGRNQGWSQAEWKDKDASCFYPECLNYFMSYGQTSELSYINAILSFYFTVRIYKVMSKTLLLR